MKHFLLILIAAFLISPTTTLAVIDTSSNGSSGGIGTSSKVSVVPVCSSCNKPDDCGTDATLKCVGDEDPSDGIKKGYCQYVNPDKIALCNPLQSSTIGDLIKRLSDFVFNVALVLTPILVLYAGFLFLTSAGDPKKVSAAKSIILWTVIGLGIILLSKGIVAIMKGLLGI